jgi:CBS domain-containing membrane protein
VSTLVGVAAGKLLDDVTLAAAVAVGVAVPVMMALRCVHPPGGACALFAAVGGSAVADHGWAFALWPVGVDTLVLLVVAGLVNNLTGRPYPHVPEPPRTAAEPPPTERVGLRAEDVRAAMDRLDRGLDVMPGDVLALVRDAEAHALDRRLGRLRVGALMARDVRTVQPQETLYRARMLMNQHAVKALPVVTGDARVVGIVTVHDLFNLDVAALRPVADVMSSPVTTVGVDTPVSELVGLMADRGLRHLPVVDDDGRLTGIVTRAELVAVLHRALVGS